MATMCFTLLIGWERIKMSLEVFKINNLKNTTITGQSNLITDCHFSSNQSFSPSDNFISILRVPFLFESVLHSFSLLTVWFCSFWRKNIGKKAARKILMKLTTGHLYTYKFFVCMSFRQLFLVMFWLWQKNCTKNAHI